MIFIENSQSTTLQNASHLPWLFPSSSPSKQFNGWVAEQDKTLESSTRQQNPFWRCFELNQCLLSLHNALIHLQFIYSYFLLSHISLCYMYLSLPLLTMTERHHTSPPHPWSSNKRLRQSQQDSQQLQYSSKWQFTMWWNACSVTTQWNNGQAASKIFLFINSCRVTSGNTMNANIGKTHTS